MDIKELRLDNIVNVKGSKKHRGVTVEDFRLAINGENPYLTPIALDEEWLLRFRFKRHDDGSVSAQFSYGMNPVTQDYLIYLVWIRDYENDYQLKGFPFYNNGHFEIKYVHQLQNLYFALTGKELTLK